MDQNTKSTAGLVTPCKDVQPMSAKGCSEVKEWHGKVEDHCEHAGDHNQLQLQVAKLNLSTQVNALAKELIRLRTHRLRVVLQLVQRDMGLQDFLHIVLHDTLQGVNLLLCFGHLVDRGIVVGLHQVPQRFSESRVEGVWSGISKIGPL